MKYIYSLFLLLSVCKIASAQQVDNALLLDYYQNQKYADAYKYLKGIYTEPVTDMKALANLAYTSRMGGSLADAESYYLRIYNKDSTNTAILFNLGSINVARGNNVKAIGYYKKILLIDSTNFNVYKELASLSQTQLDTVSYGYYLVKANTINPQEPDVAYDLSRFYLPTKKYNKAEAVLNIAIQADSSNLILLKGKAEVNFLEKKYPETIATCAKLLQSGEKNAYVIQWMAISYYLTRQYKLSLATFQLLPNYLQNESVFYYEAMCYKALGDQPNAIIFLQKAIVDGVSPNVADYYSGIGDSQDILHQVKKATASYQKSLQFKETSLVYYSLASLFDTELKDKASAIKYYKKYLASKPDAKEEQKYIDYATSRIPALGGKLSTVK